MNVTDGFNDGAAEGEFERPLDGLVDSVIVGIKLGPCEGTELGAVVEASPAVPCPGVVSNTTPPPTSGTPVLKECLRLRLRRLFPIPPFCSVTELSTFVTTTLLPVLVAPVAVLLVALLVLSALDDFLLLLFPVFLVRVVSWA